jgi:hypothetical protein
MVACPESSIAFLTARRCAEAFVATTSEIVSHARRRLEFLETEFGARPEADDPETPSTPAWVLEPNCFSPEVRVQRRLRRSRRMILSGSPLATACEEVYADIGKRRSATEGFR